MSGTSCNCGMHTQAVVNTATKGAAMFHSRGHLTSHKW